MGRLRSGSTSAARSPISSRSSTASSSPRRCRPLPARPGGGSRGCVAPPVDGRGRRARARDDGGDERAARAARRAHGAGHDGGLPRRDRDRPAGRASLYDLTAHRPAPLVPRELRFIVRERMGPDGVLVPLDEESRRRARSSRARGRRRGDRGLPALLVPASRSTSGGSARRCGGAAGRAGVALVEVLPEFREYERCSTTVAERVPRARAVGVPRADARSARAARDAVLRRRGRSRRRRRAAGGVRALGAGGGSSARRTFARVAATSTSLTFDMGGTCTDVSPCSAAGAELTPSRSSAACRSASRWSTCTRSARAAARSPGSTRAARFASGPRSAGADPGPGRATAAAARSRP